MAHQSLPIVNRVQFLTLPMETRCQVYKILFDNAVVHIDEDTNYNRNDGCQFGLAAFFDFERNEKDLQAYPPEKYWERRRPARNSWSTQIFATCKQVHDEAKPLFYDEAEFLFESIYFENIVFGKCDFSSIRNLSWVVDGLEYRDRKQDIKSIFDNISTCLRWFSNLQRVFLRFYLNGCIYKSVVHQMQEEDATRAAEKAAAKFDATEWLNDEDREEWIMEYRRDIFKNDEDWPPEVLWDDIEYCQDVCLKAAVDGMVNVLHRHERSKTWRSVNGCDSLITEVEHESYTDNFYDPEIHGEVSEYLTIQLIAPNAREKNYNNRS